MTVAALIDSLEDQGLLVWEDGGRLQYLYEGEALPQHLRDQVTARRAELLQHLDARGGRVALRGLPQAYWLGEDPAFTHATPAVLHLVYAGPLPPLPHLQDALDRLVELHPPLAFTLGGSEPVLLTRPPCRPRIEVVQGMPSRAARRCDALPESARRMPGPGSGEPLFRLFVVHDGQEDCLHAVFRLVLFDAPSVHIFMRDLLQLTRSTELPARLRPDYATTATTAAAKRRLCEERLAARAYWTARIPRLPSAPALPLRRGGPGGADGEDPRPAPRFIEHRHRVPGGDYAALTSLARDHGVTVNAVLMGVYLEVLARWSAKPTVCVSAMLSKRVTAEGVDDRCIGNQGDILLLGLDAAKSSFAERVRGLQADLAAGLKHRAYDGVSVMRRWSAMHSSGRTSADPPLPYVFSSLLGTPLAELPLEQCDHRMLTPQIWIDAQAYEADGTLWLTWDELDGVFEPGVVRQAFAAFAQTVDALALGRDAWHFHELALPAAVMAPIDASNKTARAFPAGALFDGLIALAGSSVTATKPAAICGSVSLSFHGLACKASRLAAHLNENGVGPSDHVVVRGDKSLDTLVAIYAVLMAGATYIPVSRSTPALRVHAINKQGAATTVLGDDDEDIAHVSSSPVMWTLNYARFLADLPDDCGFAPPAYPVPPTQIAYIIFTSGSTGTPKGVAMTHAAALNTLQDCHVRFRIQPEDRLLALSELNFDLSVFDLFMPALAGCAVVMPPIARSDPERTDPAAWLEAATTAGATVWNSVPSLMELLLSHARSRRLSLPASLRLWMASGDWIPLTLPGRIRAHLPGARFVSLGGATEAAIWSNTYEVAELQPHWATIPYGTPMANQRFHVLDRAGRRCPPLVTGMLHIAGEGLAVNYVNDPERTAHAFFVHEALGERLYRTGDLVRWGQDGVLELLGRVDEQVKIRGFRVELSEIEAVMGRHPQVDQVAAVSVGAGAAARLLAFVVPGGGLDGGAPVPFEFERDLEAFAAQRLNAYMLPSRWLYLPSLPLNANGKVDKRRLRALADDMLAGRPAGAVSIATAPSTGLDMSSRATEDAHEGDAAAARTHVVEQVIQRAAAEVLGVPVGSGDNFFDLGCTSLQAVYLLHAVNERLASALRLSDVYRYPTARGLVSRFLQGQCATPNLVPLHLSPRVDLPTLVLVHPVGGSVSCYLPLAERLRDRFNILALCSEPDTTFSSLSAMAVHHFAQLTGHLTAPRGVLFAGWSLGGVVAVELSRLAEAAGVHPCAVVTIDSMLPREPGADVSVAELDRACDAELRRQDADDAMPSGRLQARRDLFMANYRALLRHRYRSPSCPVVHGFASAPADMPGLVSLSSLDSQAARAQLDGDHRSIMAVEALPQLVGLIDRGLAALGPASEQHVSHGPEPTPVESLLHSTSSP